MSQNQVHVRSSRDLGQLIAAARRRQGLSQRQVAEALGVTQAWVSRVEQGKQRAWVGQVLRLMSFLGISLVGKINGAPDDTGKSRAGGQTYPDIDDIVD